MLIEQKPLDFLTSTSTASIQIKPYTTPSNIPVGIKPPEKLIVNKINENIEIGNNINLPIITPEDDHLVTDRMLRYNPKELKCPLCNYKPVIIQQQRKDYRQYRCRNCNHRWEISL